MSNSRYQPFTLILDPILQRSSRVSAVDICTLKTETIDPNDFIRDQVCGNRMIRRFIEQMICDGVSDCFKCDTANVKIVSEMPITASTCEIIPELKSQIDRHMASHMCYGLARDNGWDMCVSQEDFNIFHCPAVTLFMGKYFLKLK